MKLLIVAVGTRMPGWVSAGYDDYARRMPREATLELIEVKAEPRTTGKTVPAMMAAEAARIEAALPERCHRVILDERGTELTTRKLADRFERWLGDGQVTAADVQHFCRGKLADFKIPKIVVFVETLPRTASGKVIKSALT